MPVEALYALALDADGAVAGDAGALTRFQERQKQLEEAAAHDSGAPFASDARFTRLMNNATAVLRARSALADAGAAAHDTATLVPRLIGEAQALGQTLPPVNGAPAGATLERFEARAQRLQLDVTALTQGAADPGQAAQHMAESSDYLGQVIAALAGGTSALALPKVSTPEGLKHLKNLDSTYQELAAAVKRAVAAAPALPAAQSAARAIAADARDLAATQPPPAAPQAAAGLGAYLPLRCSRRGWRSSPRRWSRRCACTARSSGSGSRRTRSARRATATSRRSCACSMSSRASPTGTSPCRRPSPRTSPARSPTRSTTRWMRCAAWSPPSTARRSSWSRPPSRPRRCRSTSPRRAARSPSRSPRPPSPPASMAASVEEVSGNAERASDVARHSVEVAHKGGDAVRRTIDGMNTIRETIQETSKRIKRLGESSQEIGNIVELINDIAEQTNILALNASIQSSMAGEAGRGFAVVADEVQRLAERAANATKQIEVLVRTIQTDTNEAVVSMERSTTDVVGGALLAENAGAALEEIEQVSNQIASLVQNISGSARQQTGAAQGIARNMQILKEISAQTADTTSHTSAAIAKLAELSAGLRKSAAGFRLPGSSGERAAAGERSVKRIEEAPLSTAKVRQISALGGS